MIIFGKWSKRPPKPSDAAKEFGDGADQ